MVPEAPMNSPCKARNAIQRAVLLQRRPKRLISAVQYMAPSAVISSLLWIKGAGSVATFPGATVGTS